MSSTRAPSPAAPSSGGALAEVSRGTWSRGCLVRDSSRSTTMTSEDWPGNAPACSADMLFLPAPRGAPVGSRQAPSQYGAVIAPYRVGQRFPGSKRGLVDECSRPVSRETSFPPSNHDDGGRRREQV